MYEFESVLPGSGEIVKYKPITTGQIKKLLIYENAEDSEVIERALDEVIEGCIVTEDFDIDGLYLQDRFFLLLELRKVTKGNMYQFQSMCPSCSSQSLQTVDLQKLPVTILKRPKASVPKVGPKGRKGVIVEVKKEEPTLDWNVVKINDNIAVRLSPITRGMQIAATDIMKENFADAPISEKAVNLSGIIFALTIQEVITPEGVEKDLSLEDRIYLVDNLTQMEMEKIPAWFDKHNFGVEFSIDIVCPQCNAKSKRDVPLEDFFF